MKVQIIVPCLNGGEQLKSLVRSLKMQKEIEFEILMIDSQSDDKTMEFLQQEKIPVKVIPRETFNHGATRQLGADLCPQAEIIVYLTQDVILENECSIKKMIESFDDEHVGAAYGRQLPHENASFVAAHARIFNYLEESRIKTIEDIAEMGIKTAFISNSFAAYRRRALLEIGGFPGHVILGEDMYVAAKMLLSRWKIAYCAEARAYHSHNYTVKEEFKRYFDIGVFHVREAWIREKFGQAEGEGIKFVLSEMKYAVKQGAGHLVGSILLRTISKYMGYKLGINHENIPSTFIESLSLNRKYWSKQ